MRKKHLPPPQKHLTRGQLEPAPAPKKQKTVIIAAISIAVLVILVLFLFVGKQFVGKAYTVPGGDSVDMQYNEQAGTVDLRVALIDKTMNAVYLELSAKDFDVCTLYASQKFAVWDQFYETSCENEKLILGDATLNDDQYKPEFTLKFPAAGLSDTTEFTVILNVYDGATNEDIFPETATFTIEKVKAPTVVESCSDDPDDAKNYGVKGIVEYTPDGVKAVEDFEDSCTENMLTENYCEGTAKKSEEIDCLTFFKNCADGACKSIPCTITTDCPSGAVCENSVCVKEAVKEKICNDNLDDDGDGFADCLDLADCAEHLDCLTPTELACDDGYDNDGDTVKDCEDTDCATNIACKKPLAEFVVKAEEADKLHTKITAGEDINKVFWIFTTVKDKDGTILIFNKELVSSMKKDEIYTSTITYKNPEKIAKKAVVVYDTPDPSKWTVYLDQKFEQTYG
ncbi:hypothetical protein HYX14_01285 [Candidatus Woesearchaeota archaeon]|nr:hypothetical protein [Candidatus Woesearchaeota archaeon]